MLRPYYQDDAVTIYHGDCHTALADLSGGVDAIVTDPPYGISLDTRARYKANSDHIPIEGDDHPFDPEFLLAMELPAILWGANHYCDKVPPSAGWLVWNKVIYDGAFGTRTMASKQAEVELAWTNCVSRPKGFRHLWDGVFRDSESGTRFHPAQKPVELMSWCVQLLPKECITILDPFAGCGPTLRAAKNLGLRAVGIEIEERYCEVAAQRCAQEVLAV